MEDPDTSPAEVHGGAAAWVLVGTVLLAVLLAGLALWGIAEVRGSWQPIEWLLLGVLIVLPALLALGTAVRRRRRR